MEVSAPRKRCWAEGGGKYESSRLPTPDDAQTFLPRSTANIVVRRGKAVFDINVPKSADGGDNSWALAKSC